MSEYNSTPFLHEEIKRNQIFEEEFPIANSVQEYEILIGRKIQHLIKTDQHALMNLLYRIDVKESLTKEAFKEESVDAIAAVLARRIIERLQQKIELRKRYSDKGE